MVRLTCLLVLSLVLTSCGGVTETQKINERLVTHEICDNAAHIELQEKIYELKGEVIELRERIAMLENAAVQDDYPEPADYKPIIDILKLFTGH